MKNIWKYVLIGLGTIVLEWVFLALFMTWFNGMGDLGVVVGAAFFLTFEMVICTGAIISKIENNKKNKDE